MLNRKTEKKKEKKLQVIVHKKCKKSRATASTGIGFLTFKCKFYERICSVLPIYIRTHSHGRFSLM
jgi:hypothetical protein